MLTEISRVLSFLWVPHHIWDTSIPPILNLRTSPPCLRVEIHHFVNQIIHALESLYFAKKTFLIILEETIQQAVVPALISLNESHYSHHYVHLAQPRILDRENNKIYLLKVSYTYQVFTSFLSEYGR